MVGMRKLSRYCGIITETRRNVKLPGADEKAEDRLDRVPEQVQRGADDKDEKEENEKAVLLEEHARTVREGEHREQHLGAVERRNGHEVERGEPEIDDGDHRHEFERAHDRGTQGPR